MPELATAKLGFIINGKKGGHIKLNLSSATLPCKLMYNQHNGDEVFIIFLSF